jgi:hypothetical protein
MAITARGLLRYVIPALGLTMACEDGPASSFTPATGASFNQGSSPAVSNDGGSPLDAGGSICTAAEVVAAWTAMDNTPLLGPGPVPGWAYSNYDKFIPTTIQQAEWGALSAQPITPLPGPKPKYGLCQAKTLGPGPHTVEAGGTLLGAWGTQDEVQMEYVVSTGVAFAIYLGPGYNGTLRWSWLCNEGCSSAHGGNDGLVHTYVWQIGRMITKTDSAGNPQPFQLDWPANPDDAPTPELIGEIDELFRGAVSTFSPDVFVDSALDCYANTLCQIDAQGKQDGSGRPTISFPVGNFTFHVGFAATGTVEDGWGYVQ